MKKISQDQGRGLTSLSALGGFAATMFYGWGHDWTDRGTVLTSFAISGVCAVLTASYLALLSE